MTRLPEPVQGAYRTRTGGKVRNKGGAESPALQALRGKGAAYQVVDADFVTPCWLWNGCLNSKGYAVRGTQNGGRYLVHRRVYEHAHGPLGRDEQIHHRCENRSCVRADHLEATYQLAHARYHAGKQCRANLVLAVLAEGPARKRHLDAAFVDVGSTVFTSGSVLGRMLKRGEIVRVERGVYALSEERAA